MEKQSKIKVLQVFLKKFKKTGAIILLYRKPDEQ